MERVSATKVSIPTILLLLHSMTEESVGLLIIILTFNSPGIVII